MEKNKFEGLEHQMDPSSNYETYRSTIEAAMSAGEKAGRGTIPYFSLFLKDLYATYESQETR